MKKRNKIIYWIATAWLALGMLSTGIVQLFHMKGEVEFVLNLGYPLYFLTLLGVMKICGVVVILIPRFTLLKEWAYAGFFFSMAGAIFSHIAMKNSIGEIAAPFLLLTLTVISYYFRPANRKIVFANQ